MPSLWTRLARVSSSGAARTLKCSSVSETTLIAASSSGPLSAAISTEVSSRTGTSLQGPGVRQLAPQLLEIPLERGVGGSSPELSKLAAGYPLTGAGGPQLGDWTTGDGDGDLLTGLGSAQDLADFVAQLFLGNR